MIYKKFVIKINFKKIIPQNARKMEVCMLESEREFQFEY